MKRLFCTLICLVVGTFPLYAQVSKGKTVVEGSKKISEAASKKLPSGMVNVGKLTTGGAAGNAVNYSSQMAKIGKQAKVSTRSTVDHSTNVTHLSAKDLRRPLGSKIPDKIKVEKQQNEMLERQLAKVQADLQEAREAHAAQTFNADFGKSVLYAPLMSGEELGYSVTVVDIAGEIFGVIPSHSLPYDYYANLSKEFYVKLTTEHGTTHRVRAQVVQVSPDSMLDISLVKFSAEDESLLKPLKVAQTPSQIGDTLFSYGYAVGKETKISRTVNAQSFISMRTNQAIEGSREGFCGSPLLNANGEVVGIHTGTVEKEGNEPDVSFGTHAQFIQLLVDAYHNNGQAMYDLQLDGHTIAKLNVDEYISNYRLFDENGKMIAQQNIPGKYSESLLRGSLRAHPQAKYMHLTTRKAYWESVNIYEDKISPQMLEMTDHSTEFSMLRENRGKTDKTKRQHWYNLQTHEIEQTRPAVIKM